MATIQNSKSLSKTFSYRSKIKTYNMRKNSVAFAQCSSRTASSVTRGNVYEKSSASRREAILRQGGNIALLLGGLQSGIFTKVPSANALLDQDDDDELLEKIRAKKAVRLTVEAQQVTLQNALNELREVGQLIIDGDEEKLKSQVSMQSPWIVELKAAASKMATSSDTKKYATEFFTNYDGLATSIQNGTNVKANYVKTSKAFQSWCEMSGIANELKGF